MTATREDGPNAVGEAVTVEVGDAEESSGGTQGMCGEYLEAFAEADADAEEVCRGKDEGEQVPHAPIGKDADILDLIALLDEADGLFDAPTGDIRFDDTPDDLAMPPHRFGGKEHERLFAEARNDDEIQLSLRRFGEPYRSVPIFDGEDALFAVAGAGDGRCVRPHAMSCDLLGKDLAMAVQ